MAGNKECSLLSRKGKRGKHMNAIIGAGAMGCLYGAKLSESPENEVILIDIWKDHIETINEKGLIIEENGKRFIMTGLKELDALK